MKNRYVGLAGYLGVLGIGLGLFILLRADVSSMISARPTQAVTTNTPAASTPTVIAGVQSWSTFTGRYFTVLVPASWVNSMDDADNGSPNWLSMNTEEEGAEFHINGIDGALIDVKAVNQPYSELVAAANWTPFQAGDLKGETRAWTYTDIGSKNIEIVLPGTAENRGPICYMALLEMPTALSQDQQDLIVRDFKEAVASLVPSPLALQSTPTAISAPPGVQSCSAGSLSVSVDGQGCTGFFCGIVILTNTGQPACTVHGRPKMEYIAHDGTRLPISQTSVPPASGNVDSEVVLTPGGSAQMLFRTPSAQCGWDERVPITATVAMEMPGIARSIILRKESVLNICGNDLPTVGWFEVGTFEATK